MSANSFKESWDNFLSYVKLIVFVVVAGGAGWYVWNTWLKPAHSGANGSTTAETTAEPTPVFVPEVITTQKPSELVVAVMRENLPALWDGFNPSSAV